MQQDIRNELVTCMGRINSAMRRVPVGRPKEEEEKVSF